MISSYLYVLSDKSFQLFMFERDIYVFCKTHCICTLIKTYLFQTNLIEATLFQGRQICQTRPNFTGIQLLHLKSHQCRKIPRNFIHI